MYSWAVAGQKVVCIKEYQPCYDEIMPIPDGKTEYTIRDVEYNDTVYINFEEIRNPDREYVEGYGEMLFDAIGFKPIYPQYEKSDIELFNNLPFKEDKLVQDEKVLEKA